MRRLFPCSRSLQFVLLVAAFSGSYSLAQNPPGSRISQPIDDRVRITLKGNVHPLAQPRYDQGAAPDDLPLERMLLVLQRGPDQEAALRQLLDDQQVKSSPRFHQWLTPEEFGKQFGPADADIQAVTGWLTTQGFQVTKVAAGRTVIEFSGTAGLVRQNLGTEIHRFRVNGEDHWANMSDPQIPAALAPVVAGFASLNNFPRRPLVRNLGTFSRSKLTGEVRPLFTYPPCQGTDCTYYYALGPTDFATIYNVQPLWTSGTDGKGQTIAVVGETNINPQDVADFRAMFGLPANVPNIIVNGSDPGIILTEETEADLDVEWTGAVAKGATIDLVVSETTEATPGIDLSALYIVDNNLAPVMSISYGACEAELGAGGNAFHSTLWEQAAAQGITVVVSSGDSGSAGCDSAAQGETAAQYGLAVSGLASTPFNVAVGGTDFDDTSAFSTYWSTTNSSPFQNSALSYIPEMTWDDGCAATGTLTACANPNFTLGYDLTAGGGGASGCINPSGAFPNVACNGNYSKPSWQSGTGVPSDGARDVPDLSLFAGDGFNASFYVICQMDANSTYSGSTTSCDLNSPYTDFHGVGGTSASAQAFAGVMALVNQAHGRQGNANYVLYPLAAQSGNTCVSSATAVSNSSCVFYDITTRTNSVICQGGSPNCNNTNNATGQYGIMVSGNPASAAYAAGSGYDLATGLGSVNVMNLVNQWTSNFAPSTTTLSLSTSPATNPITLAHGQPINFTINVTSSSGTPTGDVSLIAQTGSSSSNVTAIGPFRLSAASVSGSTIMLPGGSYNVSAHYPGDGTYGASDSTPGIPVTVTKENSLTQVRLVALSATAPPVYNLTSVPYGSSYYLRMDVTSSSGQPCASPTTGLLAYPCPTGTLTVTPAPTEQNPPSSAVPGSYLLNSQGYAEDQFIQQTPGTYNFVAAYAGDNSYNASTSPTVPITITQAPTTISIQPPFSNLGSPFPVYVVINTQSRGAGPTGTVQFLSNGVSLGQASISGTAAPTPPYSGFALGSTIANLALPVGSTNLIAQYSGDGNYMGSTSAQVTLTVTDFSVSASPSQITISAPGQTGSSALGVTPLNGFNGTVSFVVGSGCPTGATCTFSPAYVNLAGTSGASSTLTVTTTAASSAAAGLSPGLSNLATHAAVHGGSAAPTCGKPLAFRPIPTFSFSSAQAGRLSLTACVEEALKDARSSERRSLSANQAAEPQVVVHRIERNLNKRLLPPRALHGFPLPVALLWLSAGLLALALLLGSPAVRRRYVTLWFATTLLVVGVWAACGGGSSSPPPPPPSGPAASLVPSSLNFGSVNLGSTSGVQNVTLTNTGTATLTIGGISLTGADTGDFFGTYTCSSSVLAGQNCTFSMKFSPTAAGARSAAISIADNAPDSPQTVGLSGTGVQPSTPPGTYPVVVGAISGTDVHTLTVNVVVQ